MIESPFGRRSPFGVLTRGADPYADFLVAYDTTRPGAYTLDGSSRFSAVANLGSGGATFGSAQPTEAERPTSAAINSQLAMGFAVATGEWVEGNNVATAAAAFNGTALGKDWICNVRFRLESLTPTHTIWGLGLNSNSQNRLAFQVTAGSGRVRIEHRDAAGTITREDITSPVLSAGVVYNATISMTGKLFYSSFNGTPFHTGTDFTSAINDPINQFAIGALRAGPGSVQSMDGQVQYFDLVFP